MKQRLLRPWRRGGDFCDLVDDRLGVAGAHGDFYDQGLAFCHPSGHRDRAGPCSRLHSEGEDRVSRCAGWDLDEDGGRAIGVVATN